MAKKNQPVGRTITLDKRPAFEREIEITLKVKVTNIMSMMLHYEVAEGRDGKIPFRAIMEVGARGLRVEYGDRLIDLSTSDLIDAIVKQAGRTSNAKAKPAI